MTTHLHGTTPAGRDSNRVFVPVPGMPPACPLGHPWPSAGWALPSPAPCPKSRGVHRVWTCRVCSNRIETPCPGCR